MEYEELDNLENNEGEAPIDSGEEKRDELILEVKKFLDAHKKNLADSLRDENKVVFIDFSQLSQFSTNLAEELIKNPGQTFGIIEQAYEEAWDVSGVRVRFFNLPDGHEVKVRNIRARHLNELIVVEGIIRQASDVRPQVVQAKFECPSCGAVLSILQMEKKFREPSRCSCGRRGGFKVISKDMVDTQRLVIEEAPESLTGGEQPKRLDAFVKEDLVEPKMEEKTTPGSRIKMVGVLEEVPVALNTGGQSTRYQLALQVNNLIPLEETFEELNIDEEDERQILELSQDPEIFKRLAGSLAPSVWGHEEIKQSMVLQLFGGVKKERSDGQKNRGDMHILLIGDPGVAKSVMLGFMTHISPKGRYVVGKSTSGAGLTATVVKDEFLKGWSLEAGAMVLANKGLVCIDELEKMDAQDRSSMHEAMEQQTVTVSKANVQATLKAEASVLAAANPKFGRFDPYQSIAQQIDLPPALLNRFDVIFTMRDVPSVERDNKVADHVLSEHKNEGNEMVIPKELFRKYIAYAKQRVKPALGEEASDELRKFYVELRNKPVGSDSQMKPIPISARQLQALVRMSEAAAKLRLAPEVTRDDAKTAIDIMKYYLIQVGYDYETDTIDIDKASGNKMTSSKRNKVFGVRDTINALSKESDVVNVNDIYEKLEGKMDRDAVDDSILELKKSGQIYTPKRGFLQKI